MNPANENVITRTASHLGRSLLLVGCVLLSMCIADVSASSATVWQENVRPKLYVELGELFYFT